MTTLDDCYVTLLRSGMTLLRLASDQGDIPWLKVEIEFLHNIPSLIYEPNHHRHVYFWEQERRSYLEWVFAHGEKYEDYFIRYYSSELKMLHDALAQNGIMEEINRDSDH